MVVTASIAFRTISVVTNWLMSFEPKWAKQVSRYAVEVYVIECDQK